MSKLVKRFPSPSVHTTRQANGVYKSDKAAPPPCIVGSFPRAVSVYFRRLGAQHEAGRDAYRIRRCFDKACDAL